MASPSPSTWHTISPSTRPLSLSILELTPLALTLSLTLAIPTSGSSSSSAAAAQAIHHQQLHPASPSAALHHHRRKKRHPHTHGRGRMDSDDETAVEIDDSDSPIPGSWPILNGEVRFKDLLSHGVVVSVNGQPWNRIVAHVSDEDELGHEEEEDEWEADDEGSGGGGTGEEEGNMTRRRPRKARFSLSAGHAAREAGTGVVERRKREKKSQGDRAVVVVYGLSPGKEYEIELRVVGMFGEGSDGIVSSSVVIPPSPSPNPGLHPRSRANSLRSRSNPRSRSNSMNGQSDPPSSGRATPPANGSDGPQLAPPLVAPTPILSPSDAQAAQLRQHIAAAHVEKEHLQNQIKEARRASQRAEAALRVEIETVKRAIEKAGTMDMRSKQKALALQEQVKQGWAGAELAEKEMHDLEGGLAELERVLEEVKLELDTVKDEWRVVKDREDEIREKERKSRSEEDKKLAEVVGKVDKLRAKTEKKESERLELEKKLEDLERQKEEVERRNEEQKHRRGSGYWPGPGIGGSVPGVAGHAAHSHTRQWDDQHPSHGIPNLQGAGVGPSLGYGAHRGGRAGYGPRFPSSGPIRPSNNVLLPTTAPSPTHPSGGPGPYFNPHPHSPSPTGTGGAGASGSIISTRPPPRSVSAAPLSNQNQSGMASPSQAHRAISGGVNASAAPFHPTGNSTGISTGPQTGNEHHTMMPPQLQHRIYLPNVRPRPTPNFHPPPSVIAMTDRDRQPQTQGSPTSLSAPQFPPLPTTSPTPNHQPGSGSGAGSGSGSTGSKTSGPSLASIVTRAVLSPTSTLANSAAAANASINTGAGASASANASASVNTSATPNPSPPPSRLQSQHQHPHQQQQHDHQHHQHNNHHHPGPGPRIPSGSGSGTGQAQAQAQGPWSFGGPGAEGMTRTQTPPVMAIGEERWGRASPAGSSGSGAGGAGGRKGTD